MAVSNKRKADLATAFGDNDGCLTEESLMMATYQDLTKEFTIYTDDYVFIRDNEGYCALPEGDGITQGIIIHSDGLKADVLLNGASIGKTDTIIKMDPGAHSVTIQKSGYEPQDLAFTIKSGEYTERYVTLVAIGEEPTEIPNTPGTPTSGPDMRTTGDNSLPAKIVPGAETWFGWGFRNHGDKKWTGQVGVKLVDSVGIEYRYVGDTSYRQSVEPGEIKTLWVKMVVPSTLIPDEFGKMEMSALLTQT